MIAIVVFAPMNLSLRLVILSAIFANAAFYVRYAGLGGEGLTLVAAAICLVASLFAPAIRADSNRQTADVSNSN